MLCFIELYIVENSGCANGIQKDNKDDDESKAVFFAMVLNIMYYSGQNLQAVVEFTPE